MTTMYLSLATGPTSRTYGAEVEGCTDPHCGHVLTVDVPLSGRDCKQAECVNCGRSHDRLWLIYRRAYDSGLYWPFVNLNGSRHLLDATLPTTVDRLPRDARPVDPAESARLWHEDNESHTFGGPNIAAALRSAIAAANGR